MSFSYPQAIEYLNSLYNYEADAKRQTSPPFHLESIGRLLAKLGEPHKKYKVVHIAGTKGKGSVAAMLTSIALDSGLSVGTYISPHLLNIRERIQLSGEPISEKDFADAVFAVSDVIGDRPKEYATFFEVLTAAAFWTFARKKVDIAVIECGLGGKFDATNIVQSDVAIITRIGLDHTERLGNTVAEIAQDKSQIIKQGSVAIVGEQNDEALEPIIQRIEEVGAKSFISGRDFDYSVEKSSLDGIECEFQSYDEKFRYTVPPIGKFQGENSSIAIMTAKVLGFDTQNIISGIGKVKIRGRMEIIGREPLVIVDGAHNPSSAATTAGEIFDLGLAPAVFVIGINRPKDFANMLKYWSKVAKYFIFTRPDSPRAYSPEMLKNFAEHNFGIPSILEDSPENALEKARSIAGKYGTIFIAGSLYLAGDILRTRSISIYKHNL